MRKRSRNSALAAIVMFATASTISSGIAQESAPLAEAEGLPAAEYARYMPKAQRLETLQDWEKARRQAIPENVPGIYESDWKDADFGNRIAITIDDGAADEYMAMELDVLRKYGIKATFFIVGSYFMGRDGKPLPLAKGLLERAIAEGHVLGSHTWIHPRLDLGKYRDNEGEIRREFERNQAAIDLILGWHYPIVYVRPPNGAHSSPHYTVDRVLRENRQFLCNWTITAFDWCMNYKRSNPDYLTGQQVIARSVKQAREEHGGVLLFHGFPRSALLFEDLVKALKAASNDRGGFSFSTLRELIDIKYLGPPHPPR